MKNAKYYAVRVGKVPGVYDSWEECQKQTNGYPKADFKAFISKEEAERFIQADLSEEQLNENHNESHVEETKNEIDYDELVKDDLKDGYLVAFTDGSHNSKTAKSSYGVYMMIPSEDDKAEIERIGAIVNTNRFSQSNNIVGEVFGVINALDWALKNSISKVALYCDYEGLIKWANNEWNAKTEIAKFYMKELNKFKSVLDFKFVWVKGHSNVLGNEEADQLAKNALLNKQQLFKSGDNYFQGIIQSKEKIDEIIDSIKNYLSIDNTEGENGTISEELNMTVSEEPYCERIVLTWKKEKINVTFFRTTRTMLVQGKPNYLYSMFLSYYSESLKSFDMIRVLSDAYESKVENSDVEAELVLLNLPSNYPDDYQTLIKQAIYVLNKSEKTEYDYGHYTVPATRALEGHLRYLCEEANVHLPTSLNIGGNFSKDANGEYYLTNKKLKDHSNCDKIEKCYNLYYQKRHPQSHSGEITILGTTDTELIPSLSEAKDRIKEVLNLIKFE